mmetsp:Transcript_15133/g.45191  ORF Transcript_15133/g.45191 Transcript_15133/m.45191 type:complete len:357 (-) Transcript_15133:4-1074(-)
MAATRQRIFSLRGARRRAARLGTTGLAATSQRIHGLLEARRRGRGRAGQDATRAAVVGRAQTGRARGRLGPQPGAEHERAAHGALRAPAARPAVAAARPARGPARVARLDPSVRNDVRDFTKRGAAPRLRAPGARARKPIVPQRGQAGRGRAPRAREPAGPPRGHRARAQPPVRRGIGADARGLGPLAGQRSAGLPLRFDSAAAARGRRHGGAHVLLLGQGRLRLGRVRPQLVGRDARERGAPGEAGRRRLGRERLRRPARGGHRVLRQERGPEVLGRPAARRGRPPGAPGRRRRDVHPAARGPAPPGPRVSAVPAEPRHRVRGPGADGEAHGRGRLRAHGPRDPARVVGFLFCQL